MLQFPEVQQMFLDESLRLHGLGYSCLSQSCALCECAVGVDANTPEPDGRPKRFFRCRDCGVFIQCQACCVERHAAAPLHFLEVSSFSNGLLRRAHSNGFAKEWNGRFWARTSLKCLGLIYQLGHGGMKCRFPHPFVRSLTVIDTTGIHEIRYRFCGCHRSDNANNLAQFLCNTWYPASFTDPETCATFKALDFFRLLNVVGNINARDFITALERLTDATAGTGLKWLPVSVFMFRLGTIC